MKKKPHQLYEYTPRPEDPNPNPKVEPILKILRTIDKDMEEIGGLRLLAQSRASWTKVNLKAKVVKVLYNEEYWYNKVTILVDKKDISRSSVYVDLYDVPLTKHNLAPYVFWDAREKERKFQDPPKQNPYASFRRLIVVTNPRGVTAGQLVREVYKGMSSIYNHAYAMGLEIIHHPNAYYWQGAFSVLPGGETFPQRPEFEEAILFSLGT